MLRCQNGVFLSAKTVQRKQHSLNTAGEHHPHRSKERWSKYTARAPISMINNHQSWKGDIYIYEKEWSRYRYITCGTHASIDVCTKWVCWERSVAHLIGWLVLDVVDATWVSVCLSAKACAREEGLVVVVTFETVQSWFSHLFPAVGDHLDPLQAQGKRTTSWWECLHGDHYWRTTETGQWQEVKGVPDVDGPSSGDIVEVAVVPMNLDREDKLDFVMTSIHGKLLTMVVTSSVHRLN